MKSKTLSISLLIALVAGILGIFTVVETTNAETTGPADPNIVVLAKGPAVAVQEPRKPNAACVQVPLVDAVTDRTIGDAIDCFENITPNPASGGFYLDRTTYFRFPQGEVVAVGPTTAQPVLAGSPEMTHIIGDIPALNAKNIVGGTNRFENATGRVRLSGAANLADLSNRVFNCIFVIDLD